MMSEAGRPRGPSERAAGPLRIIVGRAHVAEQDELRRRFADLPECQVIVDRRMTERRVGAPSGPRVERRHRDRRSGELDTASGLVLVIH